MNEVRQAQRDGGRSLTGKTHLSESTQLASQAAQAASTLIAELQRNPDPIVSHEVLSTTFERFEEMCRRRKVRLPAELRPAIYRLLAVELVINSDILAIEPEKIASATLYNGTLDRIPQEFPEFSDFPGILRAAATGYPTDPAGFLEFAREAIARLSADEQFADFRDTPGMFRQAVRLNPKDPEGALIRFREQVSQLASDDRFVEFRDTPHIFREAASRNPADPAQFLVRVQGTVAQLAADERFSQFRNSPHIFQDAAIRSPNDPEGYLNRVLSPLHRLARD